MTMDIPAAIGGTIFAARLANSLRVSRISRVSTSRSNTCHVSTIKATATATPERVEEAIIEKINSRSLFGEME